MVNCFFEKKNWGNVMQIRKHFLTITKHRILVMQGCFKVGLYRQGLLHDLSKYLPVEFLNGAKYYQGYRSPNNAEREDKGYSEAWLHHKGRNKHHVQYWLDFDSKSVAQVLPYKFAAEAICDNIAAGKVYNGKKWNQSTQYYYWMKNKDKLIINPKVENFFESAFLQVKELGLKKALTSKNLKALYKKHCIDDKTEYI